ncbi:hypothetical protein BpHYR1_017755 [Brachionus plicatilis]|uniref:Uncharacterized protein n=1 Tax=Brachionus plicatilis TaxID=10195 RepID=A0A3M7S6C4_BRAPC|nr:hypothetical protein BpHYR1_017755 [Brachionus plicatilis]
MNSYGESPLTDLLKTRSLKVHQRSEAGTLYFSQSSSKVLPSITLKSLVSMEVKVFEPENGTVALQQTWIKAQVLQVSQDQKWIGLDVLYPIASHVQIDQVWHFGKYARVVQVEEFYAGVGKVQVLQAGHERKNVHVLVDVCHQLVVGHVQTD